MNPIRPCNRIEFIKRDLQVSRLTATKHLEPMDRDGFLEKREQGARSDSINTVLARVLVGTEEGGDE